MSDLAWVLRVVWVLVAVGGVHLSIWNLREAIRDARALGEIRNGRRIIARGWVRAEAIRLVTEIGFLIVGVVGLVQAIEVPESRIAILLTINLLVVLNSALDARDRRAVMNYPNDRKEGI